jgi:centromere protein C
MRYKPLEWWRCEKVVYGRRESGTSLVPAIKEIRRLPKDDVHPLGAKHKRKRPPRSKSQSVAEAGILDSFNPEEGWDDETEPMGIVLQYPTDQEVEQRAYTLHIQPDCILWDVSYRGCIYIKDVEAETSSER